MTTRIGIALAALFIATTAFAQNLTGTWVTTVTPPAEAGVPPFSLIFTFNADGNLLATGTSGENPALGNPCHGTWTPSRGGFAATYLCFDFDGTLQPTGMDKLRASLNVDHDKLTGRIGLTNYDTSGNEVFSACCATVEGTRLKAEPLPDALANFGNAHATWMQK